MRNHALAPWVVLGLAAIVAAGAPAAWAQSTSGNLGGTVADASGSALPGVTVTATHQGTGVGRVETTDADGSFRFVALPVGNYNISAELSGFGTVTQEGVAINVASTRRMEFSLQSSSVQESITVVDEAPLLNTEPSIGTVVSQAELQSLPLNGRQFANVAVLAPGTSLAYNSDPTKPGQLTIALNGGIGRNVNFMIDGGDNTDDTIGGALQNFNLEAVQEFKIQTSQYKAEFGRSSGGVLTVVTKTGSNDFGGSVYGFFRDDSLSSKTQTEKNAGADKQSLERKQYGASLGGPIVRDKAHFFATYEKTERDTFYTIATGGVLPAQDGKSVATPFEDELSTAKVTWNVSPEMLLQVRYGAQKNADKYGQGPLADPSSLGTLTNEYESILAGHTWQISGRLLNEALIQYTSFDNVIAADSNAPAIFFPSGVTFGQNVNSPQTTSQRKRQYKDDLTWSTDLAGRPHNFKAGFSYIDEPTLGGDFSTGLSGQYTLAADRLDAPVTDITIFGGFFGYNTPIKQYNVYVQDDWAVNDRLTINAGLRWDYWDGFDLDQRSNAIWQKLSTQTTFNEYYLKDFQGGKGGVLENDDDNFAPRLGFTWDVKGDGKQLLRGGYGVFYDFPYTNATILFPTAAVVSDYGLAYNHNNPNGIRNADGTFFRPGQPLPPNQIVAALGPAPNEVASPTLATPYSEQVSIGYSWQVNPWLGVNVEAITMEYHDIPYRFRANPRLNAAGQAQASRRFSDFGNFRLWYGNGRASYDGLNISGRVRRDKFELQGFYTYSEAEGNILAGADEFRLTDVGYQPDWGVGRDTSVNSLDPLCNACVGPLNTDARHRITLGGTYQAPWGINVSGMLRYRSATPYTRINTAQADLNGDSFRTDLQPGTSHVNSERGDSFSQIDIRLAREFSFSNGMSIEAIAEMFNVLNEDNPAAFNRLGVPNAFAGDAGQGEQQLIQLAARFRF